MPGAYDGCESVHRLREAVVIHCGGVVRGVHVFHDREVKASWPSPITNTFRH